MIIRRNAYDRIRRKNWYTKRRLTYGTTPIGNSSMHPINYSVERKKYRVRDVSVRGRRRRARIRNSIIGAIAIVVLFFAVFLMKNGFAKKTESDTIPAAMEYSGHIEFQVFPEHKPLEIFLK